MCILTKSILQTLKHPNIVKLFDVIETERYIGIILEYASGGELFEYILAHRALKEKDARRLFAQLISSVQYMHRKNIVHRDLKLVMCCVLHNSLQMDAMKTDQCFEPVGKLAVGS